MTLLAKYGSRLPMNQSGPALFTTIATTAPT